MAHSLAALFSPRSLAVLGVSRDPAKLGYRLLQNVKEHGFAGPVYPVNPSGDAILGSPTVRDVAALPDDVDLALVSLPSGPGPLPYRIARRLLEAYGVTFCRELVVGTPDAAVAAANEIGYPVVIKADVPGLVHKTEAAAVRLALTDESAVRESVRLGASTLVVQEQIGPGVELLVGGWRDASFGPLVALGTGGVLTEVIRDVSLRLAPVTDEEASEILREGVRERLLADPGDCPRSSPLRCWPWSARSEISSSPTRVSWRSTSTPSSRPARVPSRWMRS